MHIIPRVWTINLSIVIGLKVSKIRKLSLQKASEITIDSYYMLIWQLQHILYMIWKRVLTIFILKYVLLYSKPLTIQWLITMDTK